ncbi:MAG: hypothetical protein SchgKO_09640 [Schleiferiaceae bacterium]
MFSGKAQILSVDPAFPTQNDTVTIIYDATEGNGALAGFVPVYAHTGIVTAAGGAGNWQNVQGNWGTNDPTVLMTPLGNNLHKIEYHIPTFYNITGSATVTDLAFVFRNGNGSVVGRDASGGDIYYPVYPAGAGFLAQFFSPSVTQTLSPSDSIKIYAASNDSAILSVYDNGVLAASDTGVTAISFFQPAGAAGNHLVELVAEHNGTTVRDTVYFVTNPSVTILDPPAGTRDGITYLNDSTVRLQIHGPGKENIYVIGDFNNWLPNANHFMYKSTNGEKFWVDIEGLTPNQRYGFQYYIDGNLRIADPFSELILDPWNDPNIPSNVYPNPHPYPTGLTTGHVTLIHPGKTDYNWTNNTFQAPPKEELVIYELLIRDFTHDHSYESLTDTLDYLQRLGVNAIELMPNNEFENNESWGYNPSFHMALDKYYGTPEMYKEFIDSCHSRGIAVIMDFVLNHAFGQSPLAQMYWDSGANQPASDNPWFNVTCPHPPNCWGNDFNHERPIVKEFVDHINTYWLNEYKIDGIRFDFTKGFTNTGDVSYDNTRIALIKRMADTVWAHNPDAYVILEHWADNNEETQLSDYGCMLWGNVTHNYQEAAMGFTPQSNFEWGIYKQRNWTDPHLVSYFESHDEERVMYKTLTYGNSNGSYDTKVLQTALERQALVSVFTYTIPGPKMLYQFSELGYDVSIDDPCRVCNKPILWNYYQDPDRRNLYNITSAIINLRNQYSTFHTDNFTYSLSGSVKTIHLNDPNMDAVVLGNFDVLTKPVDPAFQHTGMWYEFFTGDSLDVTDPNATISLAPGEYRIYTTQKTNIISVDEWNSPAAPGLLVFPNPADDVLSIQSSSEYVQMTEYQLIDGLGRVVASGTFESNQEATVAVSELPIGMYFLQVSFENGLSTVEKVMVK